MFENIDGNNAFLSYPLGSVFLRCTQCSMHLQLNVSQEGKYGNPKTELSTPLGERVITPLCMCVCVCAHIHCHGLEPR